MKLVHQVVVKDTVNGSRKMTNKSGYKTVKVKAEGKEMDNEASKKVAVKPKEKVEDKDLKYS